jgi:hypothetical protein
LRKAAEDCLKSSIRYTTPSPAECRVLVLKPGECVLKMR